MDRQMVSDMLKKVRVCVPEWGIEEILKLEKTTCIKS